MDVKQHVREILLSEEGMNYILTSMGLSVSKAPNGYIMPVAFIDEFDELYFEYVNIIESDLGLIRYLRFNEKRVRKSFLYLVLSFLRREIDKEGVDFFVKGVPFIVFETTRFKLVYENDVEKVIDKFTECFKKNEFSFEENKQLIIELFNQHATGLKEYIDAVRKAVVALNKLTPEYLADKYLSSSEERLDAIELCS